MIAFRPKLLDCLPGYGRHQLAADVSSGITVGVLALPLAMAFAIASGVSPTAGIWTAIVAGFLISALGGSRVQIGGPTGAFIPIIFGIAAQYGLANLLIATMLAGAMLLAMGLARMGALIRFIPISVVIGFTNGIAVVIFMAQIKDFLGLPVEAMPAEFFGKLRVIASHVDRIDPPTVALATASLLFLLGYNRLAVVVPLLRRAPGPLAVLVVATTATALFGLPVDTVGSRFGGIPQEVPSLAFPAFSLETLGKLISPALTIALLGAIESLLSARVADAQIDDRHNPNQELMAQGIANLVAPLFGGFAATGALARTATNVRIGGRTPVAGMVHALTLLAVVLIAAPLARHIPLATLSAIVVVVAINMGEWHAFAELRRYSVTYRTILLATFFLTVLFDLTLAVEIGMVLASLFFIYRMADLTRIEKIDLEAFYGRAVHREDGGLRMAAFRVTGSMFFGAVGKLETLLAHADDVPDVLILDVSRVISIDTTGLDLLQTLHRTLEKRGSRLVLAGLGDQPASLVSRSGFAEKLGAENLVDSLVEAVLLAQRASQGAAPRTTEGAANA